MEPKLREQYGKEIEVMNKLYSLMAHPEWMWYIDTFITPARERFERDAHKPELRQSADTYVDIVRALEKVAIYDAFTEDLNRAIDRGRKAQQKLTEETNGRTEGT